MDDRADRTSAPSQDFTSDLTDLSGEPAGHKPSPPHLWRCILAEFLGTLLLVFAGCAVCLDDWQIEASLGHSQSKTLHIALTFGLALSTVIWCFRHISGAHVNPAVTLAMFITRRITLIRGVAYVLAQCLAAVIGVGLLRGLHPVVLGKDAVSFGDTSVQPPMSEGGGLLVEFIITFMLLLTVFAITDPCRSDVTSGHAPLTIGLCVTLCHLFAIKYTGASMNPARTFGPAVVFNKWKHHWIYWLGPMLGAALGGLFYDLVLAEDASMDKFKSYLKSLKTCSNSEDRDVKSMDSQHLSPKEQTRSYH